MMPDDSGMIRRVAWEELFPWLMIPRGLRLASSVPVLFVATVGVLLMPLGWWGASYVLPPRQRDETATRLVERLPMAPVCFDTTCFDTTPSLFGGPAASFSLGLRDSYRPMLAAAESLVEPLRELLRIDLSWSELAYWSLGGFWNLLVWGILGGIITRMAVVQYGCDQREGLVDACRFVGRRVVAFVGAPLFALMGVVVVLAMSMPIGWLLKWDTGVLLASALWFFVLLGGAFSTIFVAGVFFGWPLMWGALSAEEMGDVFEGTQRTFAYAFGRPLHYAFYAIIAVFVGSAAYQLAHLLAHAVVYFSFWAVSWGVGMEAIAPATVGNGNAALGGAIIAWLNSVVLMVAEAFRYSFLFTTAGVVYLLVRRDSDRIELDVVHHPQQPTRHALPPLETDEAGVPGVAP